MQARGQTIFGSFKKKTKINSQTNPKKKNTNKMCCLYDRIIQQERWDGHARIKICHRRGWMKRNTQRRHFLIYRNEKRRCIYIIYTHYTQSINVKKLLWKGLVWCCLFGEFSIKIENKEKERKASCNSIQKKKKRTSSTRLMIAYWSFP